VPDELLSAPDDSAAGDVRPGPEAPPPGPGVPHCCRLSEQLEEVLELAGGSAVQAGVLLDHLSVRGHALLAFFLALPFLQPVPLPGVSTPLGLAVALLGSLMALGLPPWLPRRWRERSLSAKLVVGIVRTGQRFLARIERFIRPRGQWYHRHPWARGIAGGVIAVSGLELALPLPILFTNTLPALVIATTAVGMLEEDALLVAVGGAGFVFGLVVFGAIVGLPLLGLTAVL
jgi:hypothetical protein